MFPCPSCPSLVEPQRQVVKGEPEEGETEPWGDRGWNLQHFASPERSTGFRDVHVTSWNESWIEAGIVVVALTLQFLIRHGEHARLTIAIHFPTRQLFKTFFRCDDILWLWVGVVTSMRRHFVSFIQDAPDDMGGILSKIRGTEKGGTYTFLFQQVEDTLGAFHRHRHTLSDGVVIHSMFARHVKLFCIKTQQYHSIKFRG